MKTIADKKSPAGVVCFTPSRAQSRPAKVTRSAVFFLLLLIAIPEAKAFNDERLADAIFIAEGGHSTKFPYGIKSVKCSGLKECRQICLNTLRNTRSRWIKAGRPKPYLEFLRDRYAPLESHPLNKNWLPNVQKIMEVLP